MKIKEICFTAMLAAIICVLSILIIPTPWGVPFTLQTFAVALSGFVLGKKYGTIATGLYVVLGAVGLPVYAGMKGGVGVLFGPTGGYIIGFLFLAFFSGLGIEIIKKANNYIITIVISIVGLIVCHILGVIVFKIITERTWIDAALIGSVPYLIKDILSVVGACIVGVIIRKALNRNNLVIAE